MINNVVVASISHDDDDDDDGDANEKWQSVETKRKVKVLSIRSSLRTLNSCRL